MFFWDAFIKLGSERLRDYGSIPYSKLIWYCDRYEVQDEEAFTHLIMKMDEVFLELNKPKSPKGK